MFVVCVYVSVFAALCCEIKYNSEMLGAERRSSNSQVQVH